MRLQTERRVSVEVTLLESNLLEAERHDVVDCRRTDVGHRQATAKPVEHCTTSTHPASTLIPNPWNTQHTHSMHTAALCVTLALHGHEVACKLQGRYQHLYIQCNGRHQTSPPVLLSDELLRVYYTPYFSRLAIM